MSFRIRDEERGIDSPTQAEEIDTRAPFQSVIHHITEPKTPLLQTSLRAHPPKVKTSLELEQEELEKIPKFKAIPLNKKIFESKGDIGVFCLTKKHVSEPQEFHFATDERIPPPAAMADLFGKLSLNSEPSRNHNPIPRNTTPNPFHLHTEKRGAEKEKKLAMDLLQKQWEEENARIPKANPYPYTTDYPVIPAKPEPKQCTRPKPFQLESLVTHEDEMQKEHKERHIMEKEEAQMRAFKAQPIIKEKRKFIKVFMVFTQYYYSRKENSEKYTWFSHSTEVAYFFTEYRKGNDIEEEKELKQMRRTMVPHARPGPNNMQDLPEI
ncbi:hypothetical protein GYH30_050061 [Glycine max]|uniref:TPX2 central domain-containing protein n=1 Tax=Glycine max TaxID=3847 RepID=K7MSC5_SOYBN|nr:hypothetical protein GYH30_050061 [Glycine max]